MHCHLDSITPVKWQTFTSRNGFYSKRTKEEEREEEVEEEGLEEGGGGKEEEGVITLCSLGKSSRR